MFKKIQNHLLLHHPLLWNIKFVPVAIVAILLHVILFIIGYASCDIDFNDERNHYIPAMTAVIIIFFSAVTGIFICTIWLVYYFRNNSFKAFYPKNSFSLYKEWLLILAICVMVSTLPLSYYVGSNLKATSYFSQDEFERRADIIAMASIFAGENYNDYGAQYDSVDAEYARTDDYTYFGKKYSVNSLLNKSMLRLSYRDQKKDSIMEYRVKRWLHENRKDSVLWLMTEFDKIAKDHHLKYNLTPETWLGKIYHPPAFIQYPKIETRERYIVNLNYNTTLFDEQDRRQDEMTPDLASVRQVGDSLIISNPYNRVVINLTENDVKLEKGIRYIYPKNFVPLNVLEDSYGEVLRAYHDRKDAWLALLGFIYFCFTLSAVIFSFRVTSGAKWLIALVVFGITAIIAGIIFVFVDETIGYPASRFIDESYFALWILIEISILAYFLFKKNKKNTKAVVLNIALWLLPWILPVLLGVSLEYQSDTSRLNGYNADNYLKDFINNNATLIALAFIVMHLIVMLFFTRAIKNWKGMAEA